MMVVEPRREIVCNFEGRRQPVVFSACEDPKEENKNLLATVKTTFTDLICVENDGTYFLQVDSKLIDLVNVHVSNDEEVFLRLWVPADRPKDQVGCYYLMQMHHHFGYSYGFALSIF